MAREEQVRHVARVVAGEGLDSDAEIADAKACSASAKTRSAAARRRRRPDPPMPNVRNGVSTQRAEATVVAA